MINTLIFDLDRTLLNLKDSERIAIRYMFENFFTSSVTFETFFTVYQKHNEYWWDKKSKYEASETEVKEYRFRDTLNELSVQTELTTKEISELYFKHAQHYWALYKDASSVLEYCSKHYQLGMITNGFTRTQNVKLDLLNIRHYFKFIGLSEEIGYSKPDPKIYEYTLNQLGVNAEHAVYIGDDYTSDILGSKNAGLTPIWFNEERKANPEGFLEFSEFKDFYSILEKLN